MKRLAAFVLAALVGAIVGVSSGSAAMPKDVQDWTPSIAEGATAVFVSNAVVAGGGSVVFTIAPGNWTLIPGQQRIVGLQLDTFVVNPTATRVGAGTVPILKLIGAVSFTEQDLLPPLLAVATGTFQFATRMGVFEPYDMIKAGFSSGETVNITYVSQFAAGGASTSVTLSIEVA